MADRLKEIQIIYGESMSTDKMSNNGNGFSSFSVASLKLYF